MLPLTAGLDMAKALKPVDARKLRVKFNERIDLYIEEIKKSHLSAKERRDRRGYRSKAILSAIEHWHTAMRAGERLPPETLRIYLLEYFDATQIGKPTLRHLYISAEGRQMMDEIVEILPDMGTPFTRTPRGSGKSDVEYHVILTLAISRLADQMGKRRPLEQWVKAPDES